MLKDFTFNLPTRIEFGKGYVDKTGAIAKEFGAKKAILVTDKGIIGTDLAKHIIEVIKEAGIDVVVFDGVKPNPRDKDCERGAEMAIHENADIVIALGGGSSMDSAKAVAALLTNRGPIANVLKPNKLKVDPTPLICIPTTAGTGSEVTSFAVITLEDEKRKTSIFDEKIRPKIAIVDPSVLASIPGHIAAATGMDALTHAIEAYTCKISTHITDAYAIAAMKLISQNLRKMVYERDDDCCEKMMMGSLLAGVAFGFSDVAGVHCLAESLGGLYDTPHGVANSIFLPVMFEYNVPSNIDKHVEVAEAIGVSTVGKSKTEIVQGAVEELFALSRDLAIPKLSELGYVDPADFQRLSEACMRNVSAADNPRYVSAEIFKGLYEKTYNL